METKIKLTLKEMYLMSLRKLLDFNGQIEVVKSDIPGEDARYRRLNDERLSAVLDGLRTEH